MSWERELLKDLNERQKLAVMTVEGPVLVLAGAGSGKTRTIVHRIGYLIHIATVRPENIIAVTFTNKAALEMQQRCLSLVGPIAQRMQIRTYHSLGLYLLRKLAGFIGYPANFTIWDEEDQKEAIEQILKKKLKYKPSPSELKYFVSKISLLKENLVAPEELTQKIDIGDYPFGELLAELYSQYELKKKLAFAMDFSDLLYQTFCILEKNPQALKEVQEKYLYYLVDEYQDTNYAQYRLLNLLASKTKNFFVVGDDDQAIYGWRGADVRNILNFKKDYPHAKVIKLEENYRSTQPILNIANSIIRHNPHRYHKTLYTHRQDGTIPKFSVLRDDQKEAEYVVKKIEELKGKVPLSEIAILYRTHAQSRLFEQSLLAKKIPYRVYGGIAFYAREEIKDVLAYLRFIDNPYDELSFARAVGNPSRGVGEKTLEKIFDERYKNPNKSILDIIKEPTNLNLGIKASQALKDFAMLISHLSSLSESLSLSSLLEKLLEESGLKKVYEKEDRLLGTNRLENIEELKNSMVRFEEISPNAHLKDYLQQISLYTSSSEIGDNISQDSVNLMTIHNAKGLEFEVVFVTGLEDKLFPHLNSIAEEQIEEERRLFYVAVTRAKTSLFLTHAESRIIHGSRRLSEVSRFLEEIDKNLYEVELTSQEENGFEELYFTKKNSSRNSRNFASLKTGNWVKHPNFGKGIVVKVETDFIHILFGDGKIRKFLLAYTPLEKL